MLLTMPTTILRLFTTNHTRRITLSLSFVTVCLVFLTNVAFAQFIRPDMAQTNGSVLSVADGGGVFYIGGTFTSVINPDGSVVARNRIAAIDASTGYTTSWNPGADNDVVVIVPSSGVVYIGGAFLNAGGQPRSRAAAIDAGTGAATAWDPQPNGTVFTMVLSGSTMYMGGAFFQIAGTNRFFLGAVDASGTGALLPWNPSADNFVFSLALSGSTMYAGGLFLNVGGMGRPRIAAIDAATGVPTAWNPSSNNIVLNVATDGTNVYAGGFFTTIGGSGRQGLAALDPATGLATAWNPNCNNGVLRALPLGSRIVAGGNYTSIGGTGFQNLASVDAVTGASTLWANPSANGQIEFNGLANVPGEATVLVGGQFTTIGGQARGFFAVLDQPVPAAAYTNTPFTETSANNGTIGQTNVITLDRTTWLPAPGTVLSTGTHYTVSGVPSGLSVVARVLNTVTVQFYFTGQAQTHAASNSVSNVQFTFTNAAVSNGNAAAIAGLNGRAIRVQFIDSVAAVIAPNLVVAPRISGFIPSVGSFGERIEIRGQGLTTVRTVSFGGIPASAFTIDSDSLITATLGSGGTGFIGLATVDTTVFSPTSFTYIVNSRPTMTGISQSTGSLGTSVVIYGRGFTGVNAVRFGGVNVLRFTVDSDSQITAILGSGASGSISVVSTLGEVFLEGGSFVYFAPQTPQILATTPEPVITGDEDYTLTVIGRNLSFFGQFEVVPLNAPNTTPTRVQVLDVSTTAATLKLPLALRRVGGYRLNLRVWDVVLSTTFTVIAVPPPRLTAQSVISTIASGQAFTVALTGTGFFRQGAVTLSLNGNVAVGRVISASEATVEIPRALNILGNTAQIRLTNFDGQFTEATVHVISRTAPIITEIQPQWYNNADGSPRLEFVLRGAGFMPPLTVELALRSTPVLRATAGEVTVLIPANFLRPSLTEPPLVLLLENADSQRYGYRVPPQFLYPVQPHIDSYASLILERRGRASLIGLPILGKNFQPGVRAMLDTNTIDVLSVLNSRCLISIPQTLFFPLQSDEPHTVTLTNPGSPSTSATVFLRFETITSNNAETIEEFAEPSPLPSLDIAQKPHLNILEAGEYHKASTTEIVAYPNPAQENITIDVSRLQNSVETLILYDVCGRIALQTDLAPYTKQQTLSLSALSRGFYTLELRGRSITQRTKIFKF